MFAIVILAAILRVPAMIVDLPFNHDPDEPRNMNLAAAMVAESRLSPGYHSYPGLMYNVGAGSVWMWSLFGDDIGSFEDPARSGVFEVQTNADARSENVGAAMVLRVATLTFDLATVLFGGLAAWLIVRRRSAFLLTSGLLAFSSVNVESATKFSPDPISGGLVGLVVLASVLLCRRPSQWSYALLGGSLGLATASKYNMALFGVTLVACHLVVTRGHLWRQVDRIVIAFVVMFAAFAVASPMTLLDWKEASVWIRAEVVHYRTGHPGAEGGAPGYYARTLFRMFGPALALIPFAFGPSHRKMTIPIAAGCLAYVVAMSTYTVRFERTMLAVAAPVAVLVAVGASQVLCHDRCARRRVAPVAALAALFVTPLVMTASALARVVQDPWQDATDWIELNVPTKASLAVDWFGPWIDPTAYNVITNVPLAARSIDEWRTSNVDFLVTTRTQLRRFAGGATAEATFYATLDEQCMVASFTSGREDILVYSTMLAPICPRVPFRPT